MAISVHVLAAIVKRELRIDRSLNGADLTGDRIWVEERRSFSNDQVSVGKRIGIDYAVEYAEMPWRFWVKDNPYVSQNRER